MVLFQAALWVLHPYELTKLSNEIQIDRVSQAVLHPYELTKLSNRSM